MISTPDIPATPTYSNVFNSRITGSSEGQPYNRLDSDKLLGHVYKKPASDRTPVYVLGDPSTGFGCFAGVAEETRARVYTTSLTDRLAKLALGWRDDGIQFYVPSQEGVKTKKLFMADGWSWQSYPIARLIYAEDNPEAAIHGLATGLPRDGGGKPLFAVLKAPETEAYPLYRVFYEGCFTRPDVLAVGDADFNYLRFQGTPPLNALHFSGLTQPSTLVIEALDQGCPYTGALATEAVPLRAGLQRWYTFDELKAKSSTGEVFLNGLLCRF